ncbi:MAG: outer membrane beta-barrel protein [Acidobacteriota bacterium]
MGKRYWLVALVALFAFVGIQAQDSPWQVSILPGYQFSSSEVDSGFVMSLDGTYFWQENFGLHAAWLYNEGKFKLGVPPYGDVKFSKSFSILEVGPEWDWRAGADGKIYLQLNVGHTFGAGSFSEIQTVKVGNSLYIVNVQGSLDNEWTYGAAFGYRYHFNQKTAMVVQGAYHRINNWDTDHWDIRVGVAFRF